MLTALGLTVDVLIALALVYLTLHLTFSRSLLASALFFVAFGLTVALAWARLAAPDVALAEAAVGGGLTGALVVRAAMQMRPREGALGIRPFPAAILTLLAAALALALIALLLPLPPPPDLLPEAVKQGSAALGLEQPVTAVLLAFRSHDTWLELAVLLATLLAVLGVRPAAALAAGRSGPGRDPVLTRVLQLILPAAVLMGGFVLWQGTSAPGGAFQGGALGATALALGYLAGVRVFTILRRPLARLLVLAGFSLPLILTLPGLLAGDNLFTAPEGRPAAWLIPVEVAVGLSVSFTLAALFTGAEPPVRQAPQVPARKQSEEE